ncbi:MAG: hypothetical protein H0X34_17305 [Chthoniobacterales bacterium]|nr:hypothetical protein [Chthoniobacterales bacterium]
MNARISDRDSGYKALQKRILATAKGKRVTVGVHEAEGAAAEGDGPTVLDVAEWNEFGTDTIPERSFIRGWCDENVDQNKTLMRKLSAALLSGKIPTVEAALNRFGLVAVAGIQARIRAGIAPENAASTIAKKGSSTPLIDSGTLWTSIKHELTDDK